MHSLESSDTVEFTMEEHKKNVIQGDEVERLKLDQENKARLDCIRECSIIIEKLNKLDEKIFQMV